MNHFYNSQIQKIKINPVLDLRILMESSRLTRLMARKPGIFYVRAILRLVWQSPTRLNKLTPRDMRLASGYIYLTSVAIETYKRKCYPYTSKSNSEFNWQSINFRHSLIPSFQFRDATARHRIISSSKSKKLLIVL
jgi:hypothetical protein